MTKIELEKHKTNSWNVQYKRPASHSVHMVLAQMKRFQPDSSMT